MDQHLLDMSSSSSSSSPSAENESLVRNCSWILALASSYGFKVDDADLKILLENRIDHRMFIRLDEEKMQQLGFSANAQLIFSRIIKVESIKKLQKFPFIKRREIKIDQNEDPLGAGSAGSVYEAEYQHATYAAKIFHKHVNDSSDFQREIRACAVLFHPNIVSLAGVIVDNKDSNKIVGVLMEKMERTLMDKIKKDSPPVKQILQWCHQTAKGILCAHSANIIHSDIKPENILLSEHDVAKLTDFGSASVLNSTIQTSIGHVRGTAQYIAPEKVRTGATRATDIFSFGMTLWAALHVGADFGLGSTTKEIKDKLSKGVRPKITNPEIPRTIAELIEKCWDQDVSQRPSIEAVLETLKLEI